VNTCLSSYSGVRKQCCYNTVRQDNLIPPALIAVIFFVTVWWVYHVLIPVLMHSLCNRVIKLCKPVFGCVALLWFLLVPRNQHHAHSCPPEILLLEDVQGQSVIKTEVWRKPVSEDSGLCLTSISDTLCSKKCGV